MHASRNPQAEFTAPVDASEQLAEALRLLARGFTPIDVPYRSKNPGREGWQNERLTAEDLAERFNGVPKNIGILMGAPSGGRVDVDIDAAEALALAPSFLPATGSRFGRAGKPNSHWLYRADPCPDSVERFKDVGRNGITLVELRSTGGQTVFPTSTHPSGERVRWDEDDEPTIIDGPSLRRAVAHLAGATLIAHRWPARPGPDESGIRHELSLALAGVLLRSGWSEEGARDFIVAVARAAGDEEAWARGENARTTAKRLREADEARRQGREPTKKVTGWPRFVELLGRDVAERAAEWLDIGPWAPSASFIDLGDEVFASVSASVSASAGDDDEGGGESADQEGAADEEEGSRVSAFSRKPFPTESLPDVPRRYVEAGGRATGAPTGFLALPLLVFAGATLGNEHRIELKPGFSQRATLYGGVVGPPGSVKSPAIDLARYPLDVLQAEAHERYAAALAAFERDLEAWEALPKAEQRDVPKPVRPTMAHLYTTNATTEALAVMLRDNRGVALVFDELTSWVHGMNAYRGGKGGDRQAFLSQWAGSPLKIDRKGQETVFVPRPCIGVVGGVQPDLLKDLADGGGRRDGFVERILWETSPCGFPRWTEDTVPESLRAELVELFRQLRQSTADRPVRLSERARARYVRWYDDNGASTIGSAATGVAVGIVSKLPLQLARIALILHCMRHPDNPTSRPVADETMADAIEIVEYYRANARVVVPAFGAIPATGVAGLMDRIERFLVSRRAIDDGWVGRTAIRDHLGRNPSSEEITAALVELKGGGRAEKRVRPSDGGRGGRPAEEWRAVLSDDDDTPTRKRENAETQARPPGAASVAAHAETYAKTDAETPNGAAPSCPACPRLLGSDELPCPSCPDRDDEWRCRSCRGRERVYRPEHGGWWQCGRCKVNVVKPTGAGVSA
ncbi:MAG: DUF3987 domain-containing protein [Chloroflexota bacterium]|nr:DUF3987 domain-containing protein [Chloroflexota bacterium]